MNISPIHIISLGAGVQSSCMALMAAKGELKPMPTCAIFADTQDEPSEVYDWLNWLEKQLPFPVYRVTKGKLSVDGIKMHTSKKGQVYTKAQIPFHTLDTKTNQIGMVMTRQCTQDYKIMPIHKKIKELAGIKRGQKHISVIQWIGISLDEIQRMKPSREKWTESIWPLVDVGMKRHDCLRWMEKNGFPKPPRSSCVFCPFHSDSEWSRLKKNDTVGFQKAVEFEKTVAETILNLDLINKGKGNYMKSHLFLHKSCKPLDTVDLSTEEERGQINMFNNECEGMCGV